MVRVLKTMLLTGAAATGLLTQALAQVDEAAQAANEASEEVVVTGSYTINKRIDTATGLGLSVRETPQSVTVVTAQRIIDQDLQTVADIVANTVGVTLTEIDDVRNTLHARGFEITAYQLDGVPLSWSLAADSGETIIDTSVYERVEFVRGATGLLTGAGEPSASINLVRKHADADELTGYVSGSIGSWDTYRAVADVSTPLNEEGTMRARAVAKYEQGESFFRLYENEKVVLYGVLEADLTDQTLVRIGASYQNSDPKGVFWGNLSSFDTNGRFIEWPRWTTTSADWTFWETRNVNYFANLEHELDNGWMLRANYNRLENSADTELLYMFGQVDPVDGTGLGTSVYKSNGESIQDSYDIQLMGDYDLFERTHEFVVGALYSTQSAVAVSYPALGDSMPVGNFYRWDGTAYPRPNFSSVASPAQDLETEQTGFYASTRLNITDQFKLIVGGRLSNWERTGLNYGVVQDYGDDNVFIPYVGALYDITEEHRLYASYTEIFQPQNLLDRNLDLLPAVDGKAYEIGLKSTFLDGRLQTTVALFRIEQDNLGQYDGQVDDPTNPNNPKLDVYRAAEGVTSEGFELEAIGAITDAWNISVGYSQFRVEDAVGRAVNTHLPRKSLKLFTTYEVVDGLTLGGGVRWESESYSEGPAGRTVQDAFVLASLMARVEVTENVSVQANVDNLFDETYFTQIEFYGQYRYGDPRNYTLSLTYDF